MRLTWSFGLVLTLCWAGCSSAVDPGEDSFTPPPGTPPSASFCTISTSEIYDGGVGKDGIPALSNPPLIPAADLTFLDDDDRVIGLNLKGRWIAVPHRILWHHEIVNLDRLGQHVAVTYCPLTGSSLVFDRRAANNAEFGVSGLLYFSNLIMYDRADPETQWPQMQRAGACGVKAGVDLQMIPSFEMTWRAWRNLYPGSLVVSTETGHRRDYGRYPYGAYEREADTIFPVPRLDPRRPVKERVLGIPNTGTGGTAFPFGALDSEGPLRVVETTRSDTAVVVFWDRTAQAATAFYPVADSQSLTFTVTDSAISDRETGSTWRIDGQAASGPLAGTRLEPVAEAYIAFWFAWALFQPETKVWTE